MTTSAALTLDLLASAEDQMGEGGTKADAECSVQTYLATWSSERHFSTEMTGRRTGVRHQASQDCFAFFDFVPFEGSRKIAREATPYPLNGEGPPRGQGVVKTGTDAG